MALTLESPQLKTLDAATNVTRWSRFLAFEKETIRVQDAHAQVMAELRARDWQSQLNPSELN